MARRGKVKLQRITDDNKRRACLRKRLASYLKKASELSTLCDVELATVLYKPDDEAAPIHWPSDLDMVRATAVKFLQEPKAKRNANAVNQLTFIREQLKKNNEKVKQMKKRNEENGVEHLYSLLHDQEIMYDDLELGQLHSLKDFADVKLKMIDDCFRDQCAQPVALPQPPLPVIPQILGGSSVIDIGGPSGVGIGGYGQDMAGPISTIGGGCGGYITASSSSGIAVGGYRRYSAWSGGNTGPSGTAAGANNRHMAAASGTAGGGIFGVDMASRRYGAAPGPSGRAGGENE